MIGIYIPKKRLVAGKVPHEVEAGLLNAKVRTVCASALCPNSNECYSQKTVTFLILGDTCTRACGFCSVKKGAPGRIDAQEPRRIAEFARELGLRYIVITSVTRDDLKDGGAGQFVKVIEALRAISPKAKIEVLTPDFMYDAESIERILSERPDVFGHNIETVRRLYHTARKGADYDRSVNIISFIKELEPGLLTKSSLMLGLGETEEEVVDAMNDLKEAGCDILTIGQYLRPRRENLPVARFASPEEFESYKKIGEDMGFRAVVSGTFVRSSYKAEETYNNIVKTGL